ncbi:hypothetical protein B0H12DRAFT_1077030 [Mycena haematopus]|nr:hypothetical protein B0H12DRAFT_1077030 [Mycena haematopus]
MRAQFLSLLLVFCTLLASQAAPIDSREFSVSARKVKAAAKPAKAPPPPVAKPAKAVPPPGTPIRGKARGATPAGNETRQSGAPPVAKPVTAPPPPVTKPAKAYIQGQGLPCSQAGVKARVNSDTEDCEGASAAELCASFDDCATCVGAGLQCAFDVKGGKCVPETTSGLTLATSKKTCDSLLAAEQQTSPGPCVQGHSSQEKQRAAHTKRVDKGQPEKRRKQTDDTTGIVEFQNGDDIKTVWNDVKAGSTFVYTQDQIKTLCLRGYEPVASTSKKAKGKAPATSAALKITSGLNNSFVVHNPFINQNVCINISSASCFPLGTGTTSAAEGRAGGHNGYCTDFRGSHCVLTPSRRTPVYVLLHGGPATFGYVWLHGVDARAATSVYLRLVVPPPTSVHVDKGRQATSTWCTRRGRNTNFGHHASVEMQIQIEQINFFGI